MSEKDDKVERRLIKARKKHNARLLGIFDVGPRHTWRKTWGGIDIMGSEYENQECIVCRTHRTKRSNPAFDSGGSM